MAIYTAICAKCMTKQTYSRPIEQRNEVPVCKDCGMPMERQLDAPKGFVDTPAAG